MSDQATRRFRASWDRTTWLRTIVSVVIVLIASVAVGFGGVAALRDSPNSGLAIIAVAALVLAILPVTALFAPQGYEIDEKYVRIKRLGRDLELPRAEIESAEPIDAEGMRTTVRICGCGGFLGHYGLFFNARFKMFRAYITRRDGLVLIEMTDGRRYLLSPEDRTGMLTMLPAKRVDAGPAGGEGEARPAM